MGMVISHAKVIALKHHVEVMVRVQSSENTALSFRLPPMLGGQFQLAPKPPR
jgi:hypothetical protein